MSEYVLTPNLGLYKPTVDADEDHWGDHLNLNADKLDSVLATSGTGLFLPLMGGQMTGPILLTGDPPTDPTEAVAKGYMEDRIADYLPLVGGSLSGPLHLNPGAPPAADEAVPKSYVDTVAGNFVAKTGDTMTGVLNLTFAHPYITLQSTSSAQSHTIFGTVNGSIRWGLELGNAVAAQDFAINRYSDAGGYVDTPISIRRATGTIDLYGRLVVNGSDRMSLEAGAGYGIIRYNNNQRRWWAGNTDIGHWAVYDETAGRTVLQCQSDGAVSAPTGFWGGYIRSYGNMTVDGALDVNGARIVSRGYNNNPAVAAHNTTGYAVGMWCESGGSLAFGWTDGAGSPNSTRAVIDRSNNFRVYGGSYADYLYSYGNADFAGSIGISGNITGGRIRATNGIMNVNGAFYVADNEGYYLSRNNSNGEWVFVEGGQWNFSVRTNGDVAARAAVYCNPLFSFGQVYAGNSWSQWFGTGGEGRALVYADSWYWSWNWNNGNLVWNTPSGWGLFLNGNREASFPSHLYVSGYVVCQGNSYGISFRSAAYNSGDVWVLGWGTMAGGYITCSANNGGAAYPLANAYSDRRLKRAISDSTLDALAITNRMKLREYEILDIPDMWKLKKARRLDRKDKRMPRSRIGVIAQEVQEIFPEGVLPGDTQEDHIGGMWTLNISNWLALLVGCVQQLSNRIEELEAA